MVLAIDAGSAEKAVEAINAAGYSAYIVGKTESGEKGVTLC